MMNERKENDQNPKEGLALANIFFYHPYHLLADLTKFRALHHREYPCTPSGLPVLVRGPFPRTKSSWYHICILTEMVAFIGQSVLLADVETQSLLTIAKSQNELIY